MQAPQYWFQDFSGITQGLANGPIVAHEVAPCDGSVTIGALTEVCNACIALIAMGLNVCILKTS